MPVVVRSFRRSDRDQLTELVNLHVSTVLPGVALSTNAVLNQLEREPGEHILDPWVAERHCLVATVDDAVAGAALVHRYRADDDVADGYRGAAELRWLVAACDAVAGECVLAEAIDLMRSWQPTSILADGSLPVPGCYGLPESWPHVRRLLVEAGFSGPNRQEEIHAAHCQQLLGNDLEGTMVRRSVGVLGARLDLMADDRSIGYIEVGDIHPALTRSSSAVTWTDVGNLFPADPSELATVMPALFSAAAEWLLLGGVDRLIDYYAEDVHDPAYVEVLRSLGFVHVSTNERGWTLP